MRLASAMLCFELLVLAAACTKDATDAMDTDSNTDTGQPRKKNSAPITQTISPAQLCPRHQSLKRHRFLKLGAKSVSSWCDARLRKARLHCDW